MAMLYSERKEPIERIVRKIFREFRQTGRKRSGELHAFRESDQTRRKVFNLINRLDVSVFNICVDKKKIRNEMRKDVHHLYNNIALQLLEKVIVAQKILAGEKAFVIADRHETSREINTKFVDCLKSYSESMFNVKIHIDVRPSYTEKGLQIADFISWASYQKYENENDEFFVMIREKIIYEGALNDLRNPAMQNPMSLNTW
jgi:hypothetical protein